MRIDMSQVLAQSGVKLDNVVVRQSGHMSSMIDVLQARDEVLLSNNAQTNTMITQEYQRIEGAMIVAQTLGKSARAHEFKLPDDMKPPSNIEQIAHIQLPVQLSEERKTADLYVFKRKGNKRADSEDVNILLVIDLEFLGHWEALLNIKNREVSVQMEVSGKVEKEQFNSNTVMLHSMLHEVGFRLVSVNIKISDEETTPLTALSALDRYMGIRESIIDIVV